MTNKIETVTPFITNRKHQLANNKELMLVSAISEFIDNEISRTHSKNKEIYIDIDEKKETLEVYTNGGVFMENIEDFARNYLSHSDFSTNSETNISFFGGGCKNAFITLTNCINGEIGRAEIATMGYKKNHLYFKIATFSMKASSYNDTEEFLTSDVTDGEWEDSVKYHLDENEEKYGTTIVLYNVEKKLFDKKFIKYLREELSKQYSITHHRTNVRIFVNRKEIEFTDKSFILPIIDQLPLLTKDKVYTKIKDGCFYRIENIEFLYEKVQRVQQVVYIYPQIDRLESKRTPMNNGGLWATLGTKFINCGHNDCIQFDVSDSKKGGLGYCIVYLPIDNNKDIFDFNIDKSLGLHPLIDNDKLQKCEVLSSNENLFERLNNGFNKLRNFNQEVAVGAKKGKQRTIENAFGLFWQIMDGANIKGSDYTWEDNGEVKKYGYLYFLTNPCFKDDGDKKIYKIGESVNVHRRVKELSKKTCVPQNYEIAFRVKSTNYKELENLAKDKFNKNAVSRNKEFFLLTKEEVLQFILSIKNDDMEVWQDEQLLPNNKVAA